MACSEDLATQGHTVKDVELEDTLSNDCGISTNFTEKPMSPILNLGLNNRKFLIGRRLSRKKPKRVKLCDRFNEAADKEHLVINPIVSIPAPLNQSMSISQTKNLIDHIDKLEQLDNSRKNLYKVLVEDNRDSENFKKLKSLAPLRIENKNKNSDTVSATSINISDPCIVRSDEVIPVHIKEHSIGFQTAMGKPVQVSDANVSKYSKLFADIIDSTQSCIGRQNKHTFLNKTDSVRHGCNDLFIDNLKYMQPEEESKLVSSNHIEGFSTASGSKIKISKIAITQAKNLFKEDGINDIEFNKNNIYKSKQTTLQTYASKDAYVDVPQKTVNSSNIVEDELSLTQAIWESGISNTQILSAVDKMLCSVETREKNDFKGFVEESVIESCTQLHMMESYLDTLVNAKNEKDILFTNNCENNCHRNPNKRKRMDWSSNKYSLEDCFLPPKKKSQISHQTLKIANYTKNNESELFMINNNLGGFSSASGKLLTISEKHMEHAKTIFDDININLQLENERNGISTNSSVGFYKESARPAEISEKSFGIAENMFAQNVCDQKNIKFSKLSIVSDKKSVDETYPNEFGDEVSSKPIESSDVFDNMFTVGDFNTSNAGFCKASGKTIKVSENSLRKVKNIFDNLNMDIFHKTDDSIQQTSTIPLKEYEMQKVIVSKGVTTAQNIKEPELSVANEKSAVENTPPVSTKYLCKYDPSYSAKYSKKKLGVSRCKLLKICDSKLDKAALLFDEDFSGISPIKPRQNTTYTSTPIRQNTYLTSPRSSFRPQENFDSFTDMGITPINIKNANEEEDINYNANEIMLCTPKRSNWMNDLKLEREKLENRLQIILKREKLGKRQLECIEIGKSDENKRPREGILYKTKTTCKQIPLTTFVDNQKPGVIDTNVGLAINSNNAENLHFKEQVSASIITKDGAVVIPNVNDLVGLCEIKNAFEAMPGVESRLVPEGWIRNHYKWIVWKLANYENMFPTYFSECLNIENIIQQLKYRYDREIDKAERSALRKIYEKDDVPQKRIVLYVADIKMVDLKNYELHLSDGWYAIRTIIDEPLCGQIINGKIKIGTKLIISGAELLNCEGCHPLEATNLVCLKINCNSTRRAAWYTKLGYQRNPNPFSIQLHSIYPLGGTIASMKISVVRVYPLKYLEKLEGCSVWRNGKAEEVAAQKWESERNKRLEQIQDEVRKRHECAHTKLIERVCVSDISNINCPKELHEILERSKDPECIQEKLSAMQRKAVLNYQSNLSMQKQAEMAAEVDESILKLKLNKRDVVSVLKLLVIDLIGYSNRAFNFFIWRPTETHLQSLIEGKSFTVQNVVPRLNGDLNSNMKTTFKLETQNNDKCARYKRRIFQLVELTTLKSPPDFNEFDTVGIVVQTKIEAHQQEVWITDNAGRLLFITISEGPSTCMLIDNLKRGQATTACNLMYRGLKKEVIHAVGNHFTIFTSNSRHKHLQEGLEMLSKEMKDVKVLLSDCDTKIEVFRIISDIKNSFSENFEVVDENMLV